MTEFKVENLADLPAGEFAKVVKSTPESKLTAAMRGEERGPILDMVFSKMPGLFRADRAGSTSAVIHWNLTGRPDGGVDSYELMIENGTCAVSPTLDHEPRLAVTLGAVEFLKLVTGSANPAMMFMMGKLKAKGDVALAANIAKLFDMPRA